MEYITLLQEKGLGPSVLAIYGFFATLYASPDHWLYAQQPVVVAGGVASAAVLLLFLLAAVFNDPLMRLLAEEELAETYIQIKLTQGPEKDFYTDYDEQTRTIIDDMDDRAHKAVLTILTGFLMGLSILAIGVYMHGTSRLLITVGAAILPVALLSYPYYSRLHEVIEYAARDATSNHEN